MSLSNLRFPIIGLLLAVLTVPSTAAHATTWTPNDVMDTDAGNRFLAASPTGVGALVSHNSDSVTLFDTNAGLYLGTISVGDGPTRASFSRNEKKLAVLNADANTVSIVKVDTLRVTDTFSVPVGTQSADLTPNGKNLYCGSYITRFVNVYSTAKGKLVKKLNIGTSDNFSTTFTSNGKMAYVSSQGSGDIAIVNVKKKKNSFDIPLVAGIPGVSALSPNGLYLAVPIVEGGSAIVFVDPTQMVVTEVINTPGKSIQSVTFSPNGAWLYATDSTSGTIITVNMANLSIEEDIVWSSGLNGLILSPSGNLGFLSNSNVDSLWKMTIS